MNDAMIYAEGYFEILNADDETEPTEICRKRNQRNFRTEKCRFYLS
jgi:hypothetical protein